MKLGKIVEFFILNEIEKEGSKDQESVYYHAFSLGYELNEKMLRGYEATSKTLSELLEDVLAGTIWTVGYVDSEFDLKYRSLEVSSQTVLEVINELSERFNALVVWDTVNRKINMYNPSNVGRNKGFKITDERYLTSVIENQNAENIVTRLRLYGYDGLTIRRISPTGTPYIEDYSYYMYPFERDEDRNVIKHSYYMSDELCHAILDYQEKIKSREGEFEGLLNTKAQFEESLLDRQAELDILETELRIILDQLDVENMRGIPDPELHQNIVASRAVKEQEIRDKNAEIEQIYDWIADVDKQILALQQDLSVENNFSKELIEEWNLYVKEREYTNESIINDEDLLQEGIKVFEEMREPAIEVNIDIINLLEVLECQNDWDKLELGDIVTIRHHRLGIDIKAKIIEINYNFEDSTIEVVIANAEKPTDDELIGNILKDLQYAFTEVNMNKFDWNLARENHGMINQIINNIWDATKQAVEAGYEQMIEISERGIIVRSPEDPKTYLVIQNGMLAITNDNGNTWKHAITSEGIVGERIYGKIILGVRLAIEDENGIMMWRGSRGQIFDRNGNEVMRLGLVSEPDAPECFGIESWNTINKISMTDCEGFSISRKTIDNDWEKIFWVRASDGTLFSRDMVAEQLKIVNNVGDEILNAETGEFDIGWFNKITADGKLTTMEKYELWAKVSSIMAEYEFLIQHAQTFLYAGRDDRFNFNAQNPESTRIPSSNIKVDTSQLTIKYNALIDFVRQYISIPPAFDQEIMERTDAINRNTFAVRFKEYYDEADRVRGQINDFLYYSGLQLGTFYNNLIIDPVAGFMAIRDDYKYRARLSATDGLVLEKWEGGWVKKLYGSLGDPNYEDGTLIAEGLVTKSLRIVDGNLGDRITFHERDGITIYGDKSTIFLNANDGIRINVDGINKFYVDTEGFLRAEDIITKNLRIVDGFLGEKIIFDHEDGITINGNNGEQIRLNANEGIAIDVNEDKRFWVGTDGLLYARRLVVLNDDFDEAILDNVTGSYIADLTVNKVRTLNSNMPQDHVFIKDNFIELVTGSGTISDIVKFRLFLEGTGHDGYPMSVWGTGDHTGNNQGYIYKTKEEFNFDFVGTDGQTRMLQMSNTQEDSILLDTPHRIRIRGGQAIRLEVNSNNYIEITSSGVKVVGSRIDLN